MDHDQHAPDPSGWSSAELQVVVAEYMTMLSAQQSDTPYVKADHNRKVQTSTHRSKGSVEFKFCNISAVLAELGHEWVQGYAPRVNYQLALKDVVLEALHGPVYQDLARGSLAAPRTVPAADEVNMERVLHLSHLWERATGGSAVAVSPTYDGDGPWPVGPSALGADEVVDSLLQTLAGDSEAQQHLVFLIGGPGNGKSALARRATAGLELVGSPDPNLAHRQYVFLTPSGQRLVVINDATIPENSEDAPHGGLLLDVRNAIDGGACLIANINRGVLQEELSTAKDPTLSGDRLGDRASEILRWLSHTAKTLGDDGQGGLNPVQARSWPATGEQPNALRVHIALMDVCSLLEERPKIVIDEGAVARLSKPYRITRLEQRESLDPDEVPAAFLLSAFLERLDPVLMTGPEWDPIRANVEALGSAAARDGLLTLLRASELASSRRFSYRELWGAYIRSILGWLPERLSPQEALDYLPRDIPPTTDPEARLEALAELADLRFHQSIVGAAPFKRRGLPDASATKNPVLRLTLMVDPALDATPDWCQAVTESLAFPDEHHSPLRTLLEHPESGRLPETVTRFDHILDDAYVAWLEVAADLERRRIESWYGGYLLRMFAIANSRPAFLRELDEWTRAWQVANWPSSLRTALRTLIFPTQRGGTSMLLPVLEARAHPIVAEPETPRLTRVIESQDTGFKKVRRGEALFISISAGSGRSAELELDFDLLREAMACNDGHLGLSDRARATLPRLERFRANLLRPGLELGYAILSGGEENSLEVQDT